MNNRITNKTLALICAYILISLSFSACKKDNAVDSSNNTAGGTPTGTLMFHIHTFINGNDVDEYNVIYTTDEGRKISLSLAQFYLSEIQLERLDGTLYDVKDKIVLKELETEVYSIGDVPVGNYKSVRFKVGLNAMANQSNPFTSPDSAILNKPEMWFGSTAQPDGFVFMHVEGKIDTTFNASGAEADMQPFSYKIGTNANYRQVIMPDKAFVIIKDQVEYVHIAANFDKVFTGVPINVANNLSVTTPADNAASIAATIADNISNLFVYE